MNWSGRVTGLVTLTIFAFACPPCAVANADSIRDSEWHLRALQIGSAQKITRGNSIVVGVIDTGVDGDHPDLLGSVDSGHDFIGNTDGRQDLVGHGTGIAGLIAGHGSGGSGILGVAPGAKILPIRVTNPTTGDLNAPYHDGAFTWAAQHGARVICAAFGTHNTTSLRDDVNAAIAADVVVVAAAGNSPGVNTVEYPAVLPGVVAVGGVTKDDEHDPDAANGTQVLIAAPSVQIASTDKHGAYATTTGTSDAAAIVAGVAALVRAKFPTMSAAEVIHRLTATATDEGPPGRDPDFGYGIVNPVAALTATVPPLSTSPSPAPPTTAAAQEASPTGPSTGTIAVLGLALLAFAAAGLSIAVRRYRRPR